MIRILVTILIGMSLVSFAPVPASHAVYWIRLNVSRSTRTQECTFETAPATARLSAQIEDPIGYPYGVVQAWSCSGDGLAVARDLSDRASTMQAEAAAYRLAHPITGASR